MLFLTCSWRFLRSDKLGQLEFKLEKIIGIEKHAGKVRKMSFSSLNHFTKGKSTFFLSKCNHAFFYRDIMRGQENEGGRAQIKRAHSGVKLFLSSQTP